MAQKLHQPRDAAETGPHPSPVMKTYAKLKKAVTERIVARSDGEEPEQASLRFGIVGAFLAWEVYSFGPRGDWTDVQRLLAIGLLGFWLISIGILASVCVWPAKNVGRRIIGMLSDVGGATFYVWLTDGSGVWMIGVYLFVTFGNGFRYGIPYLYACQTLCLAGFGAAGFLVPYWQQRTTEWGALIGALLVLPLYVSKLLKGIRKARQRAEEANRAKTTFLANMSHEIRTPLNGIVGVVDLFQATVLSPQQVELARLMRHSVSVLRSLVDDVLDITKIEAGRISIEVTPFDLHATLNGLVHLLRPHAQAKGLVLRAVVDPMLDYRLRGDSHHLRQVLLNLLGNAIKFTERGEVTIAVEQVKETSDGVTARFEVRDTGIGISPDALGRIFERFAQADDSMTRRYGGSGLGTTIAKQLVELMGGTIGVNSKLDEGSTFWVELPLLKDAPSAEGPVEALAADGELTLLVGDPSATSRIRPLVESVGGRYEIIPMATGVGSEGPSDSRCGCRYPRDSCRGKRGFGVHRIYSSGTAPWGPRRRLDSHSAGAAFSC